MCSRAGWLTLGSLRNHDGEAEDNVDLNMILYFIHESPDTALQSFTLFITVKTIAKLNPEHSDKYEEKTLIHIREQENHDGNDYGNVNEQKI